jgi:hypothetical protein
MNRVRTSDAVALLAIATIAFPVAGVGIAAAHDLPGLVAERQSLEPALRAKFEEIDQLRRLLAARAAGNPQQEPLEAVVRTALRWPNGRASVCFFDGQSAARDHVAAAVDRWTTGTSIKFGFGPPGNRTTCDPANPANIRISFRGVGYWSYVGTQALQINAFKQTLNLQGMDQTNFSKEDDGVILHEFGHAIGFEHEHQSPESGCDEQFNWPYLYTALGWSKDEVDRNMRRLDTSSGLTGLLTTTFDRKSIMLYSLASAAFKDPSHASCFIPTPNNDLSPTDMNTAQTVYPTGAPGPAAAPGPGGALPPDIVASSRRLRLLTQPN